jgi:hypothetical protein
MSTPVLPSPSPGSAPSTPLRQEYAHLLPPPGKEPEAKHVIDTLAAMVKARGGPVPLKEFTKLFDTNTPAKKKGLTLIVKQVAQIMTMEQTGLESTSQVEPGAKVKPPAKVYYMTLRAGIISSAVSQQ